jgi:hypothetical protein
MVDQVTGVGHKHMRRKAAINRDAEMTRRGADVLIAHTARRAFPTTDPRIDRDPGAGLCVRVGACAFNQPGDLVPKREGQGTPSPHVKLLAIAQQKVTVLHVEIGMTDTATLDPYKDFSTLRPRCFDNGLA